MGTTLEQAAHKILSLLARQSRDNWMTGEEISRETNLSPEDINDAVTILSESGNVEWIRTLGTAPYAFRDVRLTARGRYEFERAAEKETPQEPRFETLLPPPPIGSPYGFQGEDWEFIATRKDLSGELYVVLGHQFSSTHYDTDLLKKNVRSMFQEAVHAYNTRPAARKVELDFRPLAAGYGEHLFNEIARDVIGADIAVFETSDLNPNVMLEMGVALTWGVSVLPIKAEGCPRPPSDISGQTWADYRNSAGEFVDAEHHSKLVRMVERAARKKGRGTEGQDMLDPLDIPNPKALRSSAKVIEPEAAGPSSFGAEPSDANMPQVASWWLKGFLGPVIDVLNYIQQHFGNDSFELSASPIQPHAPVYDYRIDFFQRQRWNELVTSDLGEYFLNKYPRIMGELESFQGDMDNFDHSFVRLVTSIESSAEFLQKLIDCYERLIHHERIPKSQFAHFDLQEIAVHLLGQLHLQISHHRLESKDALVRFTAYSLLGLNLEFPKNSLPEDHTLVGFCRDGLKGLADSDSSISETLQETKKLVDVTKDESARLWKQLRRDRMEIASRYNATFE